jgi:serine/threonine-protein kinase
MTAAMDQLTSALVGSYRIERELGAGGMATVYLAHDIKHDRDVAIKVLHPDLGAALGGERFLSEIRTTARLQHPHILPLLDSGDADGSLYYVMPVVTGESLRTRLERERQLPIPDAVRIAREVASALDYAHRQGVIHRDIKPENILLHDGQAMVADFGIALAVQQAGGQRMTQTGLSLGTPQYMSPEQAMGERTIDARSDIYALGAVTYEMLAGDPPFTGSSVQAIVARVLNEKPTPLHTLRDTVPDAVEHAVLTALAKLPADRFATPAEFSTALASQSGERAGAWTTPASKREQRRITRVVAVLAVGLVLATAVAALGWLRPTGSRGQVTRVALALPAAQAILPQFYGFSLDLSPDGKRLAYIGTGPSKGTTQVWIRPLDVLDATPLAGTTGAVSVAWSPDERAVLIMTTRQSAAVVSVDGGQIVPLRNINDASWGADGRIYSDDKGANILRQTVGGVADTLYRGDTNFILGHPMAFPRGDGALFVHVPKGNDAATKSEIVAMSFAEKKPVVVGLGVYARLMKSGSLLFASADGSVFIAPFDQSKLRMTGAPVPFGHVAMGANSGRSYPQITVSDEGTYAYLGGALQRQRLAWLDASGRVIRRLPDEGDFWGIALSPDATRLAFTLRADNRDPNSAARGTGDVWVEDLASGARTRLTNEGFSPRPSWTPDGKSVLYARVGGPENQALFERRADASEPERLVVSMQSFGHTVGDGHWLPDHRTLLVRTYLDAGSIGNIYYTTVGSTDTAHPVATTPATETAPNPSPDGSMVAYVSDETGTNELYVQRFPTGGERLLVSKGGASPGRWSHDGRSLYYWDQHGKLVIASITSRPALGVAGVRVIETDVVPEQVGSNYDFDVAPDGRLIVTEDVHGLFDLVLVRNGMTDLVKRTIK